MTYARVLAEGRVRPESVEDLWEMDKNHVDLPTGLNNALAQNQLLQWFDALPPSDIGCSVFATMNAGV